MNLTLDRRLSTATAGALWAFALLTTLSIALQNVFFVALAAWLFRRLFVQKKSLGFPRWGWVWVAFMAWALLASTEAPNQAHSLETWRKWLLAAAAWCAADAVEDERQVRGLMGTLLVGGALVNLGAALWFGFRPLGAFLHGMPWPEVVNRWVMDSGVEWRARGGSGGYMVLAGCDTLLILFFSGLALEDPTWRRPAVWSCLGAIALGLLLTMTRGAWLATALGLGLLLLWRRPRAGAASIAGLALLVVLFPGSVFVQRLKTVGDLNNGSNRERLYLWQTGLSIIRDRPLLGVGDSLSSFRTTDAAGLTATAEGYFLRYRSPDAVAWFKDNIIPGDREIGHLHDVPLQLAAMYGLPGLGLAFLFFAGLVVWGLKLRRAGAGPLARGAGLGLAAGLFAFFVHGITEYNLGSVQSSFTVWFVVGLAVATARLETKPAGSA